MKKMLLLMMCWPAMLAAQNGVTVSDLSVNAGTITFNVSWNADEVPGGKVWVFVDYNKGGGMERLPVTGVAASAGTAEWVNDKGAWVINSQNVDNFLGTVTLSFNPQLTVTGACAYASNYPPEAEYITAQTIKFTGTPLYDIVLKNAGNDTIYRTSGTDYGIPGGYTIVSFTDKTGAPGIVNCIPPVTYTLNASASSFCADDATGVTFTLDDTENGRKYRLYRGGTAVSSEITGDGNGVSFGAFNVAGTYTALSIADELYCPIAMNGSHVVIENPLPADPDVNNATRNCPGTVTLSAFSSGAVIDWYTDLASASTLYTGASYTTPEIETSTTYYVQARVESTGCLSARVAVAAEVDMDGCCDAPGTTVDFTAFYPCNADFGSTWTLRDTRESNNVQTYKVKLLADNHYWMVQDMKFGNLCKKTTFSGSNGKNQQGKLSDIAPYSSYYGDCTNATHSSTPANRGYMYDWAAAINKAGAYQGSASNVGCSGAASGMCQGICPDGWHVPTCDEFRSLNSAFGTCSSSCWTAGSGWESVIGGMIYGNGTFGYTTLPLYITSTMESSTRAYEWQAFGSGVCDGGSADDEKSCGRPVRCIRDYET